MGSSARVRRVSDLVRLDSGGRGAPAWLLVVRDVGFPAAVCAVLLWSTVPKLDALVEQSARGNELLRKISDRGCVMVPRSAAAPSDGWILELGVCIDSAAPIAAREVLEARSSCAPDQCLAEAVARSGG